MTREEASFILANIDRRAWDNESNDALDMAIQVLEREPCEDYISRKATAELIRTRLYESAYNNVGYTCEADKVFADIAENRLDLWLSELPSVIPTRKKGIWEPRNIRECLYGCSICGYQELGRRNYCAKCGADMREGEEE